MATQVQVDIPIILDGNMKTTISGQLANGQNFSATILSDQAKLMSWLAKGTEETIDFVLLSIFVYGIDRSIPRRPNSVDGWSRELQISIPVFQIVKWRSCETELEGLLSFLTGDTWTVSFYKNTLQLPAEEEADLTAPYNGEFSQVNLFSGGLDSLIGAIDSLEQGQATVLFVSHYDRTMSGPKKDQHDLSKNLEEQYRDRFLRLPSIGVHLSASSLSNRETTSRSRSLLFIGLALALAEVKDAKIVVPENGTVSINYPLSPSRRSSCSTRTTHPTFIEKLEDLWQKLGILVGIENPYRFKAKGEMVRDCKNQAFLLSVVALSNSCGKRGHRAHWDTTGTHCGICMPCLYRRASLQDFRDRTDYGNSINNLDFKRKKGQDVGSLLEFLKATPSLKEIKFEIIANGVQDLLHLNSYIQLIQRSRVELANWIREVGNVAVRAKAGF